MEGGRGAYCSSVAVVVEALQPLRPLAPHVHRPPVLAAIVVVIGILVVIGIGRGVGGEVGGGEGEAQTCVRRAKPGFF